MTKNDWDNPDTWAHIPEFDVKPSEVEFQGFSDFVFGPKTDTDLSENLVELIRIARKLVRKEFKTMKDVHQSSFAAWDLMVETPDEVLNQAQRAAAIYGSVMMSIEAVCSHHTSAKIKLNAMASAGSFVAIWADGDSEMALERICKRNAGNASMPRPNARAIDHDDVLTQYRYLVQQGHTERQARGILVERGNMGSQATIYRVTKEK